MKIQAFLKRMQLYLSRHSDIDFNQFSFVLNTFQTCLSNKEKYRFNAFINSLLERTSLQISLISIENRLTQAELESELNELKNGE